jgi:hypothetical protein
LSCCLCLCGLSFAKHVDVDMGMGMGVGMGVGICRISRLFPQVISSIKQINKFLSSLPTDTADNIMWWNKADTPQEAVSGHLGKVILILIFFNFFLFF